MSKTYRQRDQEERKHTDRVKRVKASAKENAVDWAGWWPFKQATGKALRQLNAKQLILEEALL